MSDLFLSNLKETLDPCICELESVRHLFCCNPETDFIRNRKISFSDLFHLMIEMESKSMPNEVMEYFKHALNSPTPSAFIQQRDKILTEAWEFLLSRFNNATSRIQNKTYKGYRLLACDGSDVNIARNPEDHDTFIQQGERGFNQIHLNALYDLLNHTYLDLNVQGENKLHERKALNTMVDRYHGSPAVFIADRGYESYNVFAHLIHKKQFFGIRLKDISSNGILSIYDLPDCEFDSRIETTLTRRHTKETKNHPDIYTILPFYTDFDYLDDNTPYYDIEFRIIRFRLPNGEYQCVATNLSADEFSLAELRELYHLRWGEESSFRKLKYTIGLINFHSKQTDFIIQEIYARVILYNFCEMTVSQTAVITRKETKHNYKINFATAVNICRAFLRTGDGESEKISLLQRHLTPIRLDRIYPRRLRPKRNRDFIYRAA